MSTECKDGKGKRAKEGESPEAPPVAKAKAAAIVDAEVDLDPDLDGDPQV